MSPLTFKQHIFIEAKQGDRVGIPHLYHPTKSHLAMEYNTFVEFIDALNKERGVIKSSNAELSEKADGIALKFGFLADGKFFMQSSYSGIVTDPEEFESTIKYPPVKEAFKSNFNKLRELVYPALLNVKNGVIIQAEWLYSPLALERENKPGMVYFVATDYDTVKLGKWSTFVIIKCTDLNGKNLPNITTRLVKLSTDEVKFLPAYIEIFPDINLRADIVAANNIISDINVKYPDLQVVISSKSLKREDIAKRKQYKSYIQQAIAPIQESIYQKILATAMTVAGRLGDFEGIVIKLNIGDKPFMFKVNTPTFFANQEQKNKDEQKPILKESKQPRVYEIYHPGDYREEDGTWWYYKDPKGKIQIGPPYLEVDKYGTKWYHKDPEHTIIERTEKDPKTGLTLPAVEYVDGAKAWYFNNMQHRDEKDPVTGESLPATTDSKGNDEYFQNDKLHRTDGPAVVVGHGDSGGWYINGVRLSPAEVKEQKQKIALDKQVTSDQDNAIGGVWDSIK